MNVFLGSSRCGMSLIAGIVNCVPEFSFDNDAKIISIDLQSYEAHDIRWLDKLNLIRSDENRYIWVIRNPIDSSCSISSSLGITGEKALKLWFDINTILWYFYTSLPRANRFLIKYESVILTKEPVQKLFSFMGLEYNEQYMNYGDFDQPILKCSVFNLGKIDIERLSPRCKSAFLTEDECRVYRNKPLLEFLDYDISILE